MDEQHSHTSIVARQSFKNHLASRGVPTNIIDAIEKLWLSQSLLVPVSVTFYARTSKYHVRWGNYVVKW